MKVLTMISYANMIYVNMVYVNMTLSIFRRIITEQLVYVCIGLWKNLQEGRHENDEQVDAPHI